jgi:hypothetical protein
MATLGNNVFDKGLSYLATNGTRLDICSSEPATYAAVAGVSLGNKTSLSIGAPGDRTGGGRKVTVAQITDGSVTATGTATHYAITNGSSELLATGSLASSQAVTSGNTFTLAAFDIGIPDPA